MIQERLSALVAQVVGEMGFSDIEVGLERVWEQVAKLKAWLEQQEEGEGGE